MFSRRTTATRSSFESLIVEFSSFDQLSDEAINAQGFPAHLTSTQKRVLFRRIKHSCHYGHKDFDDSSVVFLIRFQSFKRFGNTRMSCCARLTVENLIRNFLRCCIPFGVSFYNTAQSSSDAVFRSGFLFSMSYILKHCREQQRNDQC